MLDKDDRIVFNGGLTGLTIEMTISSPLFSVPILSLLLLTPITAEAKPENPNFPLRLAAGRTCKQVASCAEAVELWCSGYRRADADNDGIPCENICHSREKVDRIRGMIGC